MKKFMFGLLNESSWIEAVVAEDGVCRGRRE